MCSVLLNIVNIGGVYPFSRFASLVLDNEGVSIGVLSHLYRVVAPSTWALRTYHS